MLLDRITQRQKEAANFSWYKQKIDSIIHISPGGIIGAPEGMNYKTKMMANYRLFNDSIDINDFKHVIKPYGEIDADLPADFRNRDIISGKLKAIHGIEMKRPFSHKIIAVNSEATNRREQETFKRIQQFVVSSIMKPLEMQIRTTAMEQNKGSQLSNEEKKAIESQIQEELKAQTPEEVHHYMAREHQDPAEEMMNQIFNYEIKRLNIIDAFNRGFFHSTLSSMEIYYVGEINNSPVVLPLNPLRFNCDKSPDTEYIEDGEWASYEYRLSPSQVTSFFGSELDDAELDRIYHHVNSITQGATIQYEDFFNQYTDVTGRYIPVFHCTWKSLKKIGFLTYLENGVENKTIVDENYKMQQGDKQIQWEWIPEVHEGWRIGKDIYKRMRPVKGQFHDITDLYSPKKLPYHGIIHDNINAQPISLIERMKPWQYYYNIIMYRIEMLLASDKGKIMLLNMDLIPKKEGFDYLKFLHYLDNTKIGFLQPDAKGNNPDISTAAKEIDLSLVSDIEKYIKLAEFIELKAGMIVGITKEIEGQIQSNALVGNAQSNITMASNIIQPYFYAHDKVKRNVLSSLLEIAKVCYSSDEGKEKLIYVLDDMSLELLSIDKMLLDSSTFGIFVSDATEGFETKQSIQQLFQAALQNDKADLSDLIKIMKSTSLEQAEEILAVSEARSHTQQMEMQQQQSDTQMKIMQQEQSFEEIKHQWRLEEIKLKGEIELQKQAMLSIGFDENKDENLNGVPDVVDIYKEGRDAHFKQEDLDLKKRKLDLDEQKQKDKVVLEHRKLAIQARKKKNEKT
jgi:hypothetical protein